MKNKVIWITGGTSGIGKATAEIFAKKNFNVIVTSRTNTKFSAKDSLIEYLTLDVKENLDVEKVVKKISSKGEIDCLINNAGIATFNSVAETSINEIENIINTNLLGAIYSIKAVLPQMIEKKRGTIINIISVVAKKIFINSAAYTAAKAGLEAFTNVLREELREHNIRIINIYPGATATSIWHPKVLEKYSNLMMEPKHIGKLIYDLYKTKFIVPEEITLRSINGDL